MIRTNPGGPIDKRLRSVIGLAMVALVGGCLSPEPATPGPRPRVAPEVASAGGEALSLNASDVTPMYRELMAIDLATVVRVAMADNVDIRLAKYRVQQLRGRLESTIGGVFPVLVPSALFDHVDGSVRATEGNIVNVGFNTFQPSIALQWVLNPGRVAYEIIASRKRLRASKHEERATRMETLRTAALQLYELVLAQARISAGHQAVTEAEELLRINRLRARTGTGVPADESRAEARLAERRQDLAMAMNALYQASLALTETLQLEDPTVTLIPRMKSVPPITLVRDDIPIEELLAIAVQSRPDLASVRLLASAAGSDRGATWWGAFGPQFQASYQYAGITGHANNTDRGRGIPSNLIVNPLSAGGTFSARPVANGNLRELILRGSRRADHNRDETFSFSDQHRASAGIQSRWSLSAFGDLKAADATQQQALLKADRMLTTVKTQVVGSQQASRTQRGLIEMARQQTAAAEEALRLTQASLQAGAMTTLDVLQAQDAVAQARLRYAGAVVRFNQAEIDLLAALGLLDADALTATAEQADTDMTAMVPRAAPAPVTP
ncbi:MAG: TolC family protein [Phycisphaerae bacterium]